ncbi:MAG: DUF2207 domain-containing protein [Tetrasphaera sp.]
MRLLAAVGLVLAWALAAAGPASAAEQEQIADYRVSIELDRDGSARIEERITQVFPDGQERHGITRDIRVRAGYRDREDVYRYFQLSQLSVSSQTGAPTDVRQDDYGAYVHLRIGSPDETVTGRQTYVISYRLAHIVNEIDTERAEFVHDIVGAANEQSYGSISASVTSPGEVRQVGCNFGATGSDSLCTAELGNPARFSHNDLQPGQAMTVAVSADRSAFGDLAPDLVEGSTGSEGTETVPPAQERLLGRLFAGVGLFIPVLAAAGMAVLVWSRGRDEAYAGLTPGLTPGVGEQTHTVRQARPATVAVQFTPPAGVQPGMVGTLIDEEANTVDVTATILDLAVRGFLTITETDKSFGRTDWILTLTQPPSGSVMSEYEQMLLTALFSRGTEVRLSELKNTFAQTLARVKGAMYAEVVRRGWFRQSPQSQRNTWTGLGNGVAVIGFFAIFFLRGSGGNPISGMPLSGATILGAGLIVAGLLIRVMGRRMAARTADGSAVLAQALGFRQYLVTAEANQIRFEEAQQIFSRYLPYAIVFGVADKWAHTFEEVAAAAAAAGVTIPPPIWYYGPTWGSGGFFDSVASGADSFSTQAAGTFISTPGSSGTSVFDGGGGFGGGGGFSGGGGSGSSGGTW